jgi:hypothetical protein
MRIGYLFRGFLGDVKLDSSGNELSTPDGNATYSWSIEHECNRRGYKLIPLGENLDAPAALRDGEDLFAAFSKKRRAASYERMLRCGWTRRSDKVFPELDLVLIEWRWPIPGRNTEADRGLPHFQGDLDRQEEVLQVYSERGTPIIVWDLDHKLTQAEEKKWGFDVIETAVKPRGDHVRVEPPFVVADLLQHDIDDHRPRFHMGYIGSRYERDATIDKWIGSITPRGTHRAKFWGKWEPQDDVRTRWPGVMFGDRIGVRGFQEAYSQCAVVPLLAKNSYYECGFITPRPWEAVLFGSVPVGLAEHRGIYQYCEMVAQDPTDLLEFATTVRTMSPIRRRVLREQAAHRLYHMDVRGFMDVIEGLVGDAVAGEDPEVAAENSESEKRDAED